MTDDRTLQVQATELAGQAATVDGVAEVIEQARSAAAGVTLGREAYGILCQLIPSLLEPVQHQTVEALRQATDSLQRSADDLRATARDYTGSDQRTADVFRGGGR